MNLITADFETHYTNDGLGFKTQTTEEYVNDPRFHVIGVSVKVNDEPTVWYTGEPEYVFAKLHQYDWDNAALLCHNTLFDGFILSTHFGIIPKMYLDTLSMARAVHGVDVGGSLKFLAEKYKIGVKGTEVDGAMNLKRTDFTPKQLAQYGEYCKNDVEITFALFQKLVSEFPEDELKLIDMTIRMFTQPVLEVDDAMLSARLAEIHKDKNDLLNGLMSRLECANEETVRKILASNKQFAELLTELGVTPPMKESPTTGKQTFALAKNDEGFLALCEHEDEFIQRLCAVRLGTKSTLEESRIARFIDIAARNKGCLPIPLKYYGAHTGRWSGMDSVNFQNLPSRDKKKKTLKNAIIVPEGHTLINCDSSQIEARVLAWLAGQDELTAAFARGEDVYSIFASKIYNRPISKADPVERFVGKTCILGLGYGTGALKLQHTLKTSPPGAILSEQECKDIVSLYREMNDKIPALWRDGDGVLSDLANWGSTKPYWLGKNECLRIEKEGIKLPNGLYIRYPGLYLNTEESKSQYMYKSRKGPVYLWGGTVVENCIAAGTEVLTDRGWVHIENVEDNDLVHDGVEFVPHGGRVFKSVQPCVSIDGVYMTPDHEVLTDDGWIPAARNPKPYRPDIRGAHGIEPGAQQRKDVVLEVPVPVWEANSEIGQGGDQNIEARGVPELWVHDQTTHIQVAHSAWYEQASRVCGMEVNAGQMSFAYTPILEELRRAGNNSLRKVASIVREFLGRYGRYLPAQSGSRQSRQRWWVQPAELSVGYAKSRFNEQAQYREKGGCSDVKQEYRHLPINNLLSTRTRLVTGEADDTTRPEKLVYDILNAGPRQRFVVRGDTGAFIVHNCVQALARIIVGQQMLKIHERYPVKLTVHDAALVVVKNEEFDDALKYVVEVMSTPPAWAAGLPVACEAKHGESYGQT